jgi:hypothetical protein
MSAQNSQINLETPQKLPNKLLAQLGIVSLCKENVGMVEAKKHQNSAQADNPHMYLRPGPLKIFGLWLAPVLYVEE